MNKLALFSSIERISKGPIKESGITQEKFLDAKNIFFIEFSLSRFAATFYINNKSKKCS